MKQQERVTKHLVGAYPSQWAAWRQQAEAEGVRSVSALIRRAMTEYVLRRASVVRWRRRS